MGWTKKIEISTCTKQDGILPAYRGPNKKKSVFRLPSGICNCTHKFSKWALSVFLLVTGHRYIIFSLPISAVSNMDRLYTLYIVILIWKNSMRDVVYQIWIYCLPGSICPYFKCYGIINQQHLPYSTDIVIHDMKFLFRNWKNPSYQRIFADITKEMLFSVPQKLYSKSL